MTFLAVDGKHVEPIWDGFAAIIEALRQRARRPRSEPSDQRRHEDPRPSPSPRRRRRPRCVDHAELAARHPTPVRGTSTARDKDQIAAASRNARPSPGRSPSPSSSARGLAMRRPDGPGPGAPRLIEVAITVAREWIARRRRPRRPAGLAVGRRDPGPSVPGATYHFLSTSSSPMTPGPTLRRPGWIGPDGLRSRGHRKGHHDTHLRPAAAAASAPPWWPPSRPNGQPRRRPAA